jgi:hypothetical protein
LRLDSKIPQERENKKKKRFLSVQYISLMDEIYSETYCEELLPLVDLTVTPWGQKVDKSFLTRI